MLNTEVFDPPSVGRVISYTVEQCREMLMSILLNFSSIDCEDDEKLCNAHSALDAVLEMANIVGSTAAHLELAISECKAKKSLNEMKERDRL